MFPGIPMNRKGTTVAILLIVLVVGVISVYLIAPQGMGGTHEKLQHNTTIYHFSPNVTVEISPSLELFGVVYYLAMGNDTFVTERGTYLNDVRRWFSPFRNHEAVKLLRETLEERINETQYEYGAYAGLWVKGYTIFLVEYTLFNCPNPENINASQLLNRSDVQWFPEEQRMFLKKFLPALKDFAEKSNFMEFYRRHMNYYWGDLSIYANALKELPPDRFMEKYAGVSGVRYLFVHPYLIIAHGHNMREKINGTTILGVGGSIPLVRRSPQRTLWSYETAKDDLLDLPLNRDYIVNQGLDELLYLEFIYHELGHDITIPALQNESSELAGMEYFVDVTRTDMPYLARYDMHFQSRAGLIYEGFADAWADFALSHVDGDYAKLIMWMQRGWGEFWIEKQYELTEKYVERAREEGRPFSYYVPQILSGLRSFVSPDNVSEVYEENVPVTPLRALDRATVTGRVVVVYGTGGTNEDEKQAVKSAAEKIASTLRKFYGEGLTGTEVVLKPDANVTPDDLKGELVLVGTPDVNSVVKDMEGKFPLYFVREGDGRWVLHRNGEWNVTSFVLTTRKDDPAVKGELKDTSRVAILLAVRNPNNPENYVVWTAGSTAGLTGLFQDPAYYLSSYEIWSKKGIELGFYVQPLSS